MISILLLSAQLTLGGENVEKPVLDEKAHTTASVVQEKELKPSDFPKYISKTNKTVSSVKIHIESEEAMKKFIKSLYTELPTTTTLFSKRYTPKDLKTMWYDIESSILADELPELNGLAYYKPKQIGKTLRFTDETHKQYSALQVREGVDAFVKELAPTLKRKTDIETIRAISDYMYTNFKYDASSIQRMRVGNLGESALACNGLSYLADKLLESSGFKSEIRGGESHFWNIITLKDSQKVTFDVTSDIMLKTKYATLGLSSSDHISKVAVINIYTAKYDETKYSTVQGYTIDTLNNK